MTDINTLVNRLSGELRPIKPMKPPVYLGAWLVGGLVGYGIAVQFVLGLRPDLAMQFTRPMFSAEIVLLAALFLSSVAASVVAMAPDAYQRPRLLAVPYMLFLLLAGLVVIQLFMPVGPHMVMPAPGAHAMECSICIACVAFIPAASIFVLLRRGASVRQFQAGASAVLAATAIGCLTLRLSEAVDYISHLLIWHYTPTLLLAILGAYAGRLLLRW